MVAAPTFDFDQKIAQQTEPIIILGGTGGAYDEHEFFLEEDAALIPLEVFNKSQTLWGDVLDEIKNTIKKEISGPLLSLNVPFQALHADDNANEFTFSLASVYLFGGTLLDPPKSHDPPARDLAMTIRLGAPQKGRSHDSERTRRCGAGGSQAGSPAAFGITFLPIRCRLARPADHSDRHQERDNDEGQPTLQVHHQAPMGLFRVCSQECAGPHVIHGNTSYCA